ncbi:hypothetical protein C8F04DRAFT_988383 [Mycena alexandri]|uniref:Uncharacterized protein n=1 Tax=Mycena alexandri TaxID=1745969 RepID=A0AAD6TF44_9AGAR|nr:hypothetical protein C8F04DRAFT_988383 [Mycena alexandri]
MSEQYLSDYERHLTQLKAHLSGDIGPSLPSSFVPPAGYWTSREKALFFHALAVHSRLRPDLIADAVKSKTPLDVCAYIDALDRAAAAQPSLRSTLEGAMEVSEAWVDYEEGQARAVVELETEWGEETEAHRRAELLASRFQDDSAYWGWKDEQQRLWKQQDTLGQLDDLHLRMLTKIARDAEDTTAEDNGTPPSTPPPANQPFRDLSPGSRHRLANKLRMRQRRSEAKDWQPDLDPTTYLRRGPKKRKADVKKPRTRYKPRKAKKVEGEVDETPQPELSDDGGTEAQSKVQHALEAQGITATTLTESGVDVFDLTGLSKLMGAHAGDRIASTVSFGTLSVLREILLEFATTVVHQAISMREQELALKRNISVWRLLNENEINDQNVKDALQMHGFKTRNLPTVSSDDGGADDAERRRKSLEERLAQPEFHHIASHRELAPLFVRADESDAGLLPTEMDVDELAAELEDEAELDELDRKAEAVYEKELWQIETVRLDCRQWT